MSPKVPSKETLWLGVTSLAAAAVAVGDAANDLTMIEAAGIGVAMANGTDEVKKIANYITTRDNNHDGIAEVAEKFFAESVT